MKNILLSLSLFSIFTSATPKSAQAKSSKSKTKIDSDAMEVATFSGGCFWCMESPFEKMEGVEKVISGYTGGDKPNPTYEEVSSGTTGHIESIQVHYDSNKITYQDLLEIFWRQVDPTDMGGQFVDRGNQYGTAIFYHNEQQKKLAEESKSGLQNTKRFKDKKIITPIRPLKVFYPAEEYHQDYYLKNPVRYKYYRFRSGRDQYLDKTWGDERNFKPIKNKTNNSSKYLKPDIAIIKKNLTPLQFDVTQHEATEPPFKNEFWDNKKQGIYVDIVTGEPLFSSIDKYDSGTGWPSFTKPLDANYIVEKEDRKLFSTRTEVRSKSGDSHLGHVFPDGPKPTGLRYCINSASLKFIPVDELKEKGYGEFLNLFKK